MKQALSSTIVELKPLPVTAEGWCARLNADDVSSSDRAAFEAWLRVSPANRAEYELSALVSGLARGLQHAPDLRASASTHRAGVRKFAVAAAVVAAICVPALLVWRMHDSAYATDVGEQKLVSLADGSTVQLNTASAIGVDLKKNLREVTLRRGEAFFNVAHDPSRPFTVHAGDSIIQVVGTKFNVRVDEDGARVTVLEGRVKVREAGGAVELAATDVLPGQSAEISHQRRGVEAARVNAVKLTAWREGKIYFEQEPLSKVLAEVNRYTERRFVVTDEKVRNLPLSGVFRTGDSDSVAFALRETYGLRTRQDGDSIRVY